MSVPVRYSAAANYAVVDSGLSNTLQQEEQYHQQQLHTELYGHLYNNNQIPNSININFGGSSCQLAEQQQQQQWSSMSSSSLSLSSSSPVKRLPTDLERSTAASSKSSSQSSASTSSSSAISVKSSKSPKKLAMNPLIDDIDMMKPTTSTMSAAAAAAITKASAVNSSSNNNNNNNAEMQADCWRMSDEGRYGIPGAAGLDYQEYQEQQQQQPIIGNKNKNNNSHDQPMEPSLMDNDNKNINNKQTKNLQDELMALTSDELYNLVKEYNVLEDKYHTVLLLPKESRREVTAGGRDGSAYVLRCLKVWYELPTEVLFSAMSLVDRFLDRMAVKPKHMACMSVASFHLAIKQLGLKPIPAEDLVTISQCGCTAGDLERMTGVIASKLGVQMGITPITSVSYLRVFYALFHNVAKDIGGQFYEFFIELIKLEELVNRLEILLCDVKTTVITPSTLSLVLLCLHLDFHIKESYQRGSPELKIVFEYILFLQKFMRIPDRVFTCGFSTVAGILSHYNGQNKQPYKQRLVWRLSSRTLRVLRPINRFSSDLPTIEEGISNGMDDGLRSRTESISSEEEEDWPTSPIIPIFEEC